MNARPGLLATAATTLSLAAGLCIATPPPSIARSPNTTLPVFPTYEVNSDPRPAGPKDIGYEDLDPRLRDPENPNNVPGPENLSAVVRIDKLHHPHLFIETPSTGVKRELAAGSQPRWSSDGTWIACTVWMSGDCTSVLHLFAAHTTDSLLPGVPCRVENYRWAPDGRSLAVAAQRAPSDMCALYWVHIPSGYATLLDTLTVFSDYEDLTWSLDSRALVVTRVTATDVEGEPTASDLWLFDPNGERYQLTATEDYVESDPKWIDNDQILYARRRVTDPDLGNPERVVIRVTRGKVGK